MVPLLLLCISTIAQVKTNFNNETVISNQGRFLKPYKTQIDFQIPLKNITDLLQAEKREAEKLNEEKPFQLAVPVPVDLDIAKLINWNYNADFA